MAKKKEEKPIIKKGYEAVKRRDGGYSYRCQVSINGKITRRTWVTFKAAKKWKTHMVATRDENKANGIKFNNGMYFNDLVDEYLETRVGATESTKQSYEATTRVHLRTRFGVMPIREIKKGHAISLQGELEKKGHSNGGVNKIVQLFSSVLDFAVEMEYLEKNPLKGTKKLKSDARNFKYWTKEEIQFFLKAVKDHPLYNVFTFALNTGLRRGEILGLTWGNITLKETTNDNDETVTIGQVTFNEQLKPDMSRDLVKAKVMRTFSLAPGAIRVLKALKSDQPPSEYVFQTKRGTPIPPNTVSLEFKKAQKKSGVSKIMKFHGCRHSFVSYLVSENVSPQKIQQLVGHANLKTTTLYSHLNTKDEQETVKIIDFGADL